MEAAAYITDEKIPADIHKRQWAEIQYGTDDANFVEFFWSVKKSFFNADGLFRPNNTADGQIGERILMVKIYSSKRQTVIHRATEDHKRRYARQYQAFMAGEDQRMVTGTPLEIVPFIDEAWREQLHHFKVFSVEQLLSIDDGRRAEFPRGILELQRRTKEHMDMVQKNAPVANLERQNETLMAQNAEQAEIIKNMGSRLETLESIVREPRKAGRPRKVQDGTSA